MSAREQLEKLIRDEAFIEWFDDHLTYGKIRNGESGESCWEWGGSTDRAGYGKVHIKRHHETKGKGRNFFAHRLSYMIERGFIESDEYILHQCHNRLCCNPACFLIGDHNDNMADLSDSGRVSGENNHNSRLKEDQVREILYKYYDDCMTMSSLVAEYGVKQGTISDIVYGRTWKKIYEEVMEDD